MRKSYKFAKRRAPEPIRYRANYQIHAPEVQVIDAEGKMIGPQETKQAIADAQAAGYDLVEVAPNAKPPVTKYLNFGKFQYQQEKLMRKQKVRAKKVEIKGVRISAKISDHDLETKANQAHDFLDNGQKIKIEIILRGREHQHTDLAKEVIKKFLGMINIPFQIDTQITKQGGKLFMIIFPGAKKTDEDKPEDDAAKT